MIIVTHSRLFTVSGVLAIHVYVIDARTRNPTPSRVLLQLIDMAWITARTL